MPIVKMKRKVSLLLISGLISLNAAAGYAQAPKLILQITIDQFAGNQLDRFKQHIKDGGFAYLLKHGLWYDNAHHPHATTTTAAGHTTLATGTVPAIHGIIGNNIYRPKKNKILPAFADNKAKVLEAESIKDDLGHSPKNMQVPSFADALSIATLGQSKRFAISAKDRGSIPLAGHMGKAFWFSHVTGQYVSSDYYYKHLPRWVIKWNAKHKARDYVKKFWQPSLACSQYAFCQDNKKHFQTHLKGFGRHFPHPYGRAISAQYYEHVYTSPVNDELLADFAKHLIGNEKLGTHPKTDYLAISFTATDAIGHQFGPYSHESEDNFIRLNHTLKGLLQYIDKKVGLDKTWIVLSADHGVSPSPQYLKQFHYPAYVITEEKIKNNKQVKQILKRHRLKWSKLVTLKSPDLYLNRGYLKRKHISVDNLATSLAHALSHVKGMAYAVTKKRILNNAWDNPLFAKAVKNQISPKHSGDIYLITKPYTTIVKKVYDAVEHGSPWHYDSHVPVIFVTSQTKGKRLHRQVLTLDVATTLAAKLNIAPPIGALGHVLPEVVS